MSARCSVVPTFCALPLQQLGVALKYRGFCNTIRATVPQRRVWLASEPPGLCVETLTFMHK